MSTFGKSKLAGGFECATSAGASNLQPGGLGLSQAGGAFGCGGSAGFDAFLGWLLSLDLARLENRARSSSQRRSKWLK
jgi:hypothetical protein